MTKILILMVAMLFASGCGKSAPDSVPESSEKKEAPKPVVKAPSSETVKTPEVKAVPEPEKVEEPDPPPVEETVGSWSNRKSVVTNPIELATPSEIPPPPLSRLPPPPKVPTNTTRVALNTEANEVLRDHQSMMLKGSHDLLFKSLTLTPEQEKNLKSILVDKTLASMGRLSPLAGVANEDEARGEIEEKLKALLGDQYVVYEKFQATRNERTQLSGIELEVDLAQELIGLMHEERQQFEFTHTYNGEEPSEAYSDEAIARHFNEYASFQSNLVVKAGELLKGEDFAQFVQNQARWSRVEKMRIRKMAKQHQDQLRLLKQAEPPE